MNRAWNILIFGLLSITMMSCFKKDDIIPLKEYKGQAFVFNESIYTHQFFYDLSTNSIVSKNENEAWDVSFDCSPSGYAVRINTSNLLGVCQTNTTDFNSTEFPSVGLNWKFDKSNGDADSTGIEKWVNITVRPYEYSNKVYLIGKYNGVSYDPLKKLVLYEVTDTSYRFKYSDISGNNVYDKVILKDTNYNHVYYSFTCNDTVYIEPRKQNWDLLFTQYSTILYTVDQTPLPYFVRGTLINPHKVIASVDSIHTFIEISKDIVNNMQFKSDWDIIGHDWKEVQVDVQSNTAVYSVRPNYSYIIKDMENNYYKLKFISFFNDMNTPGYPSFFISKINY